MKKHFVIATAVCLTLVGLAFGLKRQPRSNAPNTLSQTKSLREKAKRERTHVENSKPTSIPGYSNLAHLVKDSPVILIGTVEATSSRLFGPEETFIVTDIQIRVNNILKGLSTAPDQPVVVSVPGGKVQFADGSIAEVKMPDFWRNPEVGKTYFLFLTGADDNRLKLVGGPQGLFEITSAATIQPQVRAEDPLMKRYAGTTAVSFVQEIQTLKK